MYASFTCSALADAHDERREAERLFELGLRTGREFYRRLEKGEIRAEDADRNVPIAIMTYGTGPNVEFRLGRLYQAAAGWVDRELESKTPTSPNTRFEELQSLRKALARSRFESSNCRLLGGS